MFVLTESFKNIPRSPNPPGSLHVLRTVNHDAVLVGWTLPDIDEYGRSNGQVVKGYKIYVNGSFKMDVRSAYMAKALIEDLDLTRPMTVGMQTVADNGQASHKISTRFTDTLPDIGHNISNGTENGWNESGDSFRMFVALYDYDPFTSSPNKNPAVEMRFKEGDMIKVLDTSRTDGFYHGQMHGKNGLIPSNFVEEVAVASTRRKTKVKKSKSPDSSSSHQRSSSHRSRVSPKPSPSSSQRKRMMALYDYSPEEQSPQKDISSELAFKKGHIITVYGDMTLGGYYHGEMNGQEGLVPASFITELNEHSSDNDMSKKAVSFKGSNRAHHVIGNDV